jgi:hypothetical protein
MTRIRLLLTLIGAILVICLISATAFYLGYRRAEEATALAYDEFWSVVNATHALMVIGYLETDQRDRAQAALDSSVDAGIAAHWLRLRVPSKYAETPPPSTELVEHLAKYRASRPSAAAPETPNMNRSVSEYLAHRREQPH